MYNLKKIVTYAITILLVVLAHSNLAYSLEDEIVINISSNINLGPLVKGTTKSNFLDEQIIKFEIVCKQNKRIKITKLNDLSSNDINIQAEWKCGSNTGFENEFSNGIYELSNNKYYVTIKILSVEVFSNANAGTYNFNPQISVEYYDI